MNKFLLAAIAAGLWANAAASWVRPAHAETLGDLASYLEHIEKHTAFTNVLLKAMSMDVLQMRIAFEKAQGK